jgi:hypothetical protein
MRSSSLGPSSLATIASGRNSTGWVLAETLEENAEKLVDGTKSSTLTLVS